MPRFSFSEDEGQAAVEAALVLPALMLCLVLLVQPALLLYTRSVMQATAAECCRLASTGSQAAPVGEEVYREYALRRLSAVPDLPIFHVGGEEGWDVRVAGSTGEHEAKVTISCAVRPLPLVGVLAGLAGQLDAAGNVALEVDVVAQTKPGWVEGDYGDWKAVWD